MYYLCRQVIHNRGWSYGMIIMMLGKADKEALNPQCRRGRPMKLYNENRVLVIEGTSAFRKRQEKMWRRQQGAFKGWEQHRKRIAEEKSTENVLPFTTTTNVEKGNVNQSA